jgi:hypothetical protein
VAVRVDAEGVDRAELNAAPADDDYVPREEGKAHLGLQ